MKKAILSQLTNIKGVQTLNKARLDTLKGGCRDGSSEKYTYAYKQDDKYNDDENGCNSGGEEGFIPPPGT